MENLPVGPDGSVLHCYDSGFVVLSYLVSLAGCWTSLELLHRRTGARGYYNWYLLLAAASSMGAVAIWSMHFIGNRAIIMDKGQREVQIQYSPGYTAASFFVPTIVVGIAFFFFSISENVNLLGTAVGGILTGLAVCGMHYMGQGGISNYAPSYMWPYVVGSAVIAGFAATIALGLFFYFRSVWTDSWWKRGLCASLLAVAVSGMHWTATVGTRYGLKPYPVPLTVGLSRQATVIVVICLSIGCCIILITFALIGQRSRRRSADRAQQVVLACATFDPDGRLMVTPGGLLPCRKITDAYLERSFEDVFDVDHPVFCWIFRASRCWQSVAEMLPSIRGHLRYTLQTEPFSPSTTSQSRPSSILGNIIDYATLFKEFFCVAAKDLADMIQEPLEDIGVLSGCIMATGTIGKAAQFGLRLRKNTLNAAERGESPMFGRGQLLFVVRQADHKESSRLQAAGHRFAAIPNVIETLARSMEVTRDELLPRLESLRDSSSDEHLLEPGVHLACFALRPVFHKGFDVLVRQDAANLLPTTFLKISKLEQYQMDLLMRMDNLTVSTCCDLLREKRMVGDQREHDFAAELLESILQLVETIDSPFFTDARLVARPLTAPCSPSMKYGVQQHAYIVAFRGMMDAHQNSTSNPRLAFAPLKFFLCQQHAFKDSRDNAVFARKIHQEFAALSKHFHGYNDRGSPYSPNHYRHHSSTEGSDVVPAVSPSIVKKKSWQSRVHLRGFDAHDENSSEKNLVNIGLVQPYGGIHVSNEVDVDVSEVNRGSNSSDIEMSRLGGSSEARVGDNEPNSFADELVAVTVDDRKKGHMTRR